MARRCAAQHVKGMLQVVVNATEIVNWLEVSILLGDFYNLLAAYDTASGPDELDDFHLPQRPYWSDRPLDPTGSSMAMLAAAAKPISPPLHAGNIGLARPPAGSPLHALKRPICATGEDTYSSSTTPPTLAAPSPRERRHRSPSPD